MDNKTIVNIWSLICVTTMVVAGFVLLGANHDSDNDVRIEQIRTQAK